MFARLIILISRHKKGRFSDDRALKSKWDLTTTTTRPARMGRKLKMAAPDPRSLYQTKSVVKKVVSVEVDDGPVEVEAPSLPDEQVIVDLDSATPPATPSPPHERKNVRPHQIPKLALDWKVYPAGFTEHVKLALTKRRGGGRPQAASHRVARASPYARRSADVASTPT